jgi:hypothetical protein
MASNKFTILGNDMNVDSPYITLDSTYLCLIPLVRALWKRRLEV